MYVQLKVQQQATFHLEIVTSADVYLRLTVSTLYAAVRARFLGSSLRYEINNFLLFFWFSSSILLYFIDPEMNSNRFLRSHTHTHTHTQTAAACPQRSDARGARSQPHHRELLQRGVIHKTGGRHPKVYQGKYVFRIDCSTCSCICAVFIDCTCVCFFPFFQYSIISSFPNRYLHFTLRFTSECTQMHSNVMVKGAMIDDSTFDSLPTITVALVLPFTDLSLYLLSLLSLSFILFFYLFLSSLSFISFFHLFLSSLNLL